MKVTVLAIVFGGLLVAAAGTVQTVTGVITDTMCGAKHTMMKGQPDEECARMCAKGSAEYALYDGKNVWKLSDQKAAAKFAAKRVKVTGVADQKTMTIKSASMEASEASE
jgi:uncharacterized protein YaeQ